MTDTTIPHMKRNVALLSLCQGYAQTSVTVVISVSALASLLILEDKSLANAAACLHVGGDRAYGYAGVAVDEEIWPSRWVCHRIDFWLARLRVLYDRTLYQRFLGVYRRNVVFWRLNAFNQYLRFAQPKPLTTNSVQGDIVGDRRRHPGGVRWRHACWQYGQPDVAAVCCHLHHSRVTPILFAITIQFVKMPEPEKPPPVEEKEKKSSGRPLGQIMKQPAFVVAAIGTSVSWAGMILMMAATPLSMKACGLIDDVPFVIQWHMFAMFAPSFFAGQLVSRFGNLNVIMMGSACSGGHCFRSDGHYTGQFLRHEYGDRGGLEPDADRLHFAVSDVPHGRRKGQGTGANDTIAYGLAAISSFAGYLQIEIGWNAVMIAIVPQIVIVALVVWWMRSFNARTVVAE